jgi:hypothetical protein
MIELASRRRFLEHSGVGMGIIALQALLMEQGLLWAETPTVEEGTDGPGDPSYGADPLAPKTPPIAATAKSVIFLFMSGGPSHLETFDPKPELQRLHGQKLPDSFGAVKTRRGVDRNKLLATKRTFAKYGQAGIDVSDLFPNIARHTDELCVLRGCYGDSVTHPESVYLMNCGSILMGRPSLGSWVSYGMGTENRNMPAFVVLPDPAGWPKGGAPAWSNGYLPAAYQGTVMRGGPSSIANLENPRGIGAVQQRKTLDLVQRLNQQHLQDRFADSELAARISSYELAFRMQSQAGEVVETSQESAATRVLYGLDDKTTGEFGLRCLLSRRMVERGVRFVQLYCGETNGWDGHQNIEGNHGKLARESDLPIAGLLTDLKQRGLLDTTLVIWGGEFGRTPMSEGTDGRDHNPHGFSMWMAGGGVKGGQMLGRTDDVGLRAIGEDKMHVHDIHATILRLLGFDHKNLTYRHNGRDDRLTDVYGEVIRDVF